MRRICWRKVAATGCDVAARAGVMRTFGRRVGTRLPALLALSACFAFVVAAPASAGPIGLSGVQLAGTTPPTTPATPCTLDDPLFAGTPALENVMTGSLVGCWYTDTFVAHPAQANDTPSGEIQATGIEHFVGCLELNGARPCVPNSPNYGTLEFAYQFSGKFTTLGEIHGRCQHPIVAGSGTGVFAAARGVVTFNDDVGIDSGDGSSHYRAQITL